MKLKLPLLFATLIFLINCSKDEVQIPESPNFDTVLVSPSNGEQITSNSVTFKWKLVEESDNPNLRYEIRAGFNKDSLCLFQQLNYDMFAFDTREFTYDGLLSNDNTYYWKVITYLANEQIGETPTWSITTEKKTGEFTDNRDGETYTWVTIGTQTWMAENLRYKTSSDCVPPFGTEISVPVHGWLYSNADTSIACPMGWHLPSEDEFRELIRFISGKERTGFFTSNAGRVLKSLTGWDHEMPVSKFLQGNNESGFNLFASGSSQNGVAGNGFINGSLWSSTVNEDNTFRSTLNMSNFDTEIMIFEYEITGRFASQHCIRCLKD